MDWNDRYNLWSGLIGGTFLALAYFGTDQSQVQRYLSGRSIEESRRGLFFNAAAKIPMQLFILFIGAMVFVFYIYEKPPILFQPIDRARLVEPAARDAFAPIERNYDQAFSERRAAADRVLTAKRSADAAGREQGAEAYRQAQLGLDAARRDAAALARQHGGSGASDTNYIFLTFVTEHLPAGLVGLVLAVIFGATMSSISGEMSALAGVTHGGHLQAARADVRLGPSLSERVAPRDGVLGRVRGRQRAVREGARVARRGGQRAGLAVLRRDAGRVRARLLLSACRSRAAHSLASSLAKPSSSRAGC